MLLGCGGPASGPAAITFGEDACEACKMIISEAPHAAQARFESGEVALYDDIGCLSEGLSRKAAPPGEVWVTDQSTGKWIDARIATYVQSPELKTPMASGLVAFDTRPDAEAFAGKVRGRVLSFDDVKALRRSK
jgi:copper chaperone NosL